MVEEDGIEVFLAEHDYSLNNISWMAAPIDFVPVQFHDYGICQTNGEEMSVTHHARLKDFSIYDSVQEVKKREQEELAEALRRYGEKVDEGFESIEILHVRLPCFCQCLLLILYLQMVGQLEMGSS